jgi:hypothetical protein
MLEINQIQLDCFKSIKNAFYEKTKFPEFNNWMQLSNNDIWLHIVVQVMVVGRSSPYEEFNNNERLKQEINYESLISIRNDSEIAKTINHVLRSVGTRYAQSDANKCLKTKALVHNFKFLTGYLGGPKEFLNTLSQLKEDKEHVQLVIDSLKFIKNKGARDLLMELGIVKDAIALDVRIRNIFAKLQINTPKNFSNSRIYDQVENDILSKICRPLDLTGVELDRILYQNYAAIMCERPDL